jgi:hypothetical protein
VWWQEQTDSGLAKGLKWRKPIAVDGPKSAFSEPRPGRSHLSYLACQLLLVDGGECSSLLPAAYHKTNGISHLALLCSK